MEDAVFKEMENAVFKERQRRIQNMCDFLNHEPKVKPSNTMHTESGIVHARDDKCFGRSGSRLCDRWSWGGGPLWVRTTKPVTCKSCLRMLAGKFR